tara:strand:- start:872 stop:1552 length:681 start_codon:yes stop_codon:yes gene_type:complete
MVLKHVDLPKRITNDLAYLCGVFAGDGSIHYNKRRGALKVVGNPKDEKEFYFNVIQPKFKKIFGFDLNLRHHDSNTTFGFIFSSKMLMGYLVNVIGLPNGRKYEKLKIPEPFLNRDSFLINFIRGVADTDGCITFKKRYRDYPYYPVICLASRSDSFMKEIATILKKVGLKIVEIYNYHKKDERVELGYTIISRIEINGRDNLDLWIEKVGFLSPKHLGKIKKYYK